MRGRAQ
jgi:Mg/Co/Ni transporter MgtE